MRAMFIYTLHSFLFEFYPIDIYIYHVETMRISSGYAHFRNDSNSPRLHRIFPAETEVDNARITLPFFLHFSHELSTRQLVDAEMHTFSLSLSLSLPDLERKTLRVTRLRQFSRESDQRRNQKKDEFSRTSGKCRAGYFILFQSNSIEKTKRRVLFGGEIFQISQSSVLTNEQIIVQVSSNPFVPPIETLFIPLVTISYRESFKRTAFRTAKCRYFVPP